MYYDKELKFCISKKRSSPKSKMPTTPSLDKGVTSSTQYETLTGVVERLTYHSQESGYSVARLKAVGNARFD